MVINGYAKRWCEEEYDIKKEAFHIDNAYYIAKRQWAKAALKHAIVPVLAFFINFIINANVLTPIGATLNALYGGAVFTFAFWFFGIRKYDANDPWSAKGIYIFLPIFMFLTRNYLPNILTIFIGLIGTALYWYLTVYKYIEYRKTAKDVERRIVEEEREDSETSQKEYEKWKNQYQSYRFGIPEAIINDDDPLLTQARELFEGYTDSMQALKTRFRQLLKKHHPDAGGDTEFCQRIIKVYEEYQKTFD